MTTPTQPAGLLWPDYLKTPNPSTECIRRANLSRILARTLDRSKVLGDNDNYGHSGCVNAIAWAQNGTLLLSAGDDTTVRLWRMDSSDVDNDYPFVCRSVIATGHRANIFNVQMLPHSNRIVTCAGDRQIRIFDATMALDVQDGLQTEFSARHLSGRVIRCHKHRVKKLVTEDSPDLFLSLSEDGTVRQHDLRIKHNCRDEDCPAPLVEMRYSDGDVVELSNISLSRMTPYQFVVAGESAFGFLFDRRQIRKVLEYEWGTVPRVGEGLTTCVRRFGRAPPPSGGAGRSRRDHISGCRMSDTNGREVVMSYLKDNVYLFSTLDDPVSNDSMAPSGSSILPSKLKSKRNSNEPSISASSVGENREDDADSREIDDEEGSDLEDYLGLADSVGYETQHPGVPVVHPRRSFTGHRSRDTIKDVNFLGPFDEYVVSGSDDGNWFVWKKDTGNLHGIYEGDDSVVNVVEGHPHLPLVCVSGIDTTIKLFSPAPAGQSASSRFHKSKEIMQANAAHKPVLRIPLTQLLLQAGRLYDSEGEGGSPCPTQ